MPNITRYRAREISIRGYREGQGAPVLFLHGAGGLPEWGPFLQALSTGNDVLLLEHPGFGASDHPPWIRNVQDVAMYYLDVLDEYGLRDVHLIGHSLGGWIAAELAVRNCTRLASLTLLAPAGLRIKGVPSGDNFIWSQEESVRNLFHNQAFAERLLAQTLSEEAANLALTNRFMAARLGWEPRWFNPALPHWLHRITIPALVVWGENDQLLPAAYADAWQVNLPHARIARIAACGHLPHVEQAQQTSQHVLEFLGDL